MSTPSTEWKEQIGPDEDQLFEQVAQRLAALQRQHARGGEVARGLHAKTHGGLRAQLTVRGDLPVAARHGLFREPWAYDAYVRYSNGSGERRSDKAADIRGIAIKVVGAAGPKVFGDAATQDFLLIQPAALPFRSPEEFIAFAEAASAGPVRLLPRLFRSLGFRTFGLLGALARATKSARSVAHQRYHSAAPISFGPYAAKLDLVPEASGGPDERGKDNFATDLARRIAAGPLRYTLRAQFFVDDATTPIESPTQVWPEDKSPFVAIADLVIPQQDVASAEGQARAARVEALSFDPWHALVEHRPLGGIMRARSHAYRVSTGERRAAPEPTQVE